MAKKNKTIAVVGLWHLGSVYATSFAKMGYMVHAFDTNKKVIADFQKGLPPIFEPGLTDTLKKYTKNLSFSSSPSSLKNTDYIFITHDVVVDEHDLSDLSVIEKIFTAVVSNMSQETTVVISSQIPVGTSRLLIKRLEKKGVKNPKVIYFPENLRLGNAYDSFLHPERIILGSDNQDALLLFQKDFSFSCPVITMGLESSEMVKHALNCYLATCVSLSSELGDISEKVGANMNDVIKALKSDKRVSPHAPLNPGLGFAGATLGRDVQTLKGVGSSFGYKAELLSSVYKVNQNRLPFLLKKIQAQYPSFKNKKIGLLGLTYKPGTDTLRRSMSLGLAEMLHKKGAHVQAYDPAVSTKITGYEYIKVTTSVKDFSKDLDIIILMTDWKNFLDIDPEHLAQNISSKIIIDTKNFLDQEKYLKCGFVYQGIGI